MENEEDAKEHQSLKDLLLNLNKLYDQTESSPEPSSSATYQKRLADASDLARQLISHVNSIGVFSKNETVDEISTASLPYMTLSALLAYFVSRQSDTDTMLRSERLRLARSSYVDFLRLCTCYGLENAVIPCDPLDADDDEEHTDKTTGTAVVPKSSYLSNSSADMSVMQKLRTLKVERFRRRREQERRLEALRAQVASRDQALVDDELLRELHLTTTHRWVSAALEEVDAIDVELPLVHRMESRGQDSSVDAVEAEMHKARRKAPPFRPFILTRSEVQARVLGAGYPSLPTYTVEQFYDAQMAAGRLPDNGVPGADPNHGQQTEAERVAAECAAEEMADDPAELRKKRDWDEWKDTHRTGWGNRHNRS